MSKIRLIQNIGRKITRILINWEKERPIEQEGANNKALDPQGSHRTTFGFISQVIKKQSLRQ